MIPLKAGSEMALPFFYVPSPLLSPIGGSDAIAVMRGNLG